MFDSALNSTLETFCSDYNSLSMKFPYLAERCFQRDLEVGTWHQIDCDSYCQNINSRNPWSFTSHDSFSYTIHTAPIVKVFNSIGRLAKQVVTGELFFSRHAENANNHQYHAEDDTDNNIVFKCIV